MPISVVRLGTPRAKQEGPRLGTVRRPPRGVPKAQIAKRDFYDVWLPVVSPSQLLVNFIQRSPRERTWRTFERRYRAEMKRPEAARTLDLLALFSRHADFSVGCFCADERFCHRSILARLLAEHGASMK